MHAGVLAVAGVTVCHLDSGYILHAAILRLAFTRTFVPAGARE